ncbi:TenA family protein [Acidobacteria bacterium AH-259-A15]|nr:TenA family protein [Acidobacteria bacterium AH-259-A15]
MSFHEELLEKARSIWDTMLGHPFLKETAECRIEDAVFANWLQQDYLFVQGAIPFISVMVSRAPLCVRSGLATAIGALHEELRLFEEMASKKNVSLDNLRITPTCHAYIQFMLATAHSASFEEGFALLYGAEKAYFDSWTWVKGNLKGESPWQPFIEKWSDENFQQWINWIEGVLDNLADQASTSLQEKMIEVFRLTGQYELLFWDMAIKGESWPV